MKKTLSKLFIGILIVCLQTSYFTLGNAQINQQDKVNEILSKSFQITQTIEDPIFKAFMLVALASAYNKAGQKDKSLELLSVALKLTDNAGVRLDASVAYSELGLQNKVLELLSQLVKEVLSVSDVYTRVLYLAQMASSYAKINEKAKARDLMKQSLALNETLDSSTKSNAINNIATFYLKEDYVDLILQATKEIKNEPFGNDVQLNKIATFYAEQGESDKALEVINLIKDIPFIPEPLIKVAENYADIGQKDKALNLVNQVLKIVGSKEYKSYPAHYRDGLYRTYAKLGLLDKALEVAEGINDTGYYLEEVGDVAIRYVKAGQKKKGESLLLQMLKRVNKPESDSEKRISKEILAYSKAMDLAEVAIRYIEIGQKDKGMKLMLKAFEFGKIAKDDFYGNHALSDIAMKFVQVNEYDQALKVTDIMTDKTQKTTTLIDIAVKYNNYTKQSK